MLKIGAQAPSFNVVDSDKQPLNNQTIAGKRTLILFFPAAFTGVCTKELCSVRDDLSRYNNMNVQVIAVSTDTLFTLAKYKEEQGLNFILASDYNKEMCKAFDASYDEFVFGMKGTARRSAFIIDTDGSIQYAEVLESAGDLPDFEAINKTLERLAVTA